MEKALAFALRPKIIDDIIGQSHLLKDDGIVKRIVASGFCTNIIFYSPPGIGKTSIANALALTLDREILFFNASNDKKEKLQTFIERRDFVKTPILIIDEIHRMNKNLQDYLLEYAEERKVIIFCTTTENPFFSINAAVRSRCAILQLKEISTKEMVEGLQHVFKKHIIDLNIDEDVFTYICRLANGDVRQALNIFEIILNLYSDKKVTFDLVDKICESSSSRAYKSGDEFHDLKSALQKSIRGSNVDASLHY